MWDDVRRIVAVAVSRVVEITSMNNSSSNPTVYLSPRQLHERYGLHIESCRRLCRDGRLPAIRIGKRLRIALADVEAFETNSKLHRRTEVVP